MRFNYATKRMTNFEYQRNMLLGIFAKYSEFLPERLSDDEKQELETLGLTLLAKKKS